MSTPSPPTLSTLVPTTALIEHLVRCRGPACDRALDEAIALAEMIERVHARRDDCPHGLTDLLVTLRDDLEDHSQKEIAVLFPLMMVRERESLARAISRMRVDHDELIDQLAALGRLTQQFTPPSDAESAWCRLYRVCARLHDDLSDQIRLENTVLFARFGPPGRN